MKRLIYIVLIVVSAINLKAQSPSSVKGGVYFGVVSLGYEMPIQSNSSLQLNLSRIDLVLLDWGVTSNSASLEYRKYRSEVQAVTKSLYYWMISTRFADGQEWDYEYDGLYDVDYLRFAIRGGFGEKYILSNGLTLDCNLIFSLPALKYDQGTKYTQLTSPMIVPTLRIGYSPK